MIKFALVLVALAACTNNSGGGGGGDDGVTHVVQLAFDANLYSCVDSVLADVDPNVPGPQYECSVSEYQNYGQSNQVETLLPQCNDLAMPSSATNKPCWAIESDPTNCPNADHIKLAVERAGAPPANTKVVAQCVAAGA